MNIDLILSQISLGQYISPVKLGIYMAMVLAWLPIVVWVHRDSEEVRTNVPFWTGVVFAIPAMASILCLFIPFFIIGLLLLIIAIVATIIVYIIHRNAMVSDFEKVMTAEHIKGLLVNNQKNVEKAIKGIVFETANKNEVEPPAYKTPEFFGFQLTQDVIDDAIWKRASDITFIPSGENYNIFYKIDGIQIKQDPKERQDIEYLIRFLKNLADLDINERRKPQVGNFKAKKEKSNYEFQVTTTGSTAGEKVAMIRVEEDSVKKIEEIGLTSSQIKAFNTYNGSEGGIFLVTGPAASGVTTTFYACIKNHDPFLNNINTLEKKETAELQNVTQNYFRLTDTGTTTYARRLQTMLRTGPDIIGIGDCEDAQAASTLAKMIKSDRKISYLTFQSPSIMQAFSKWLKFVPDKDMAIDALAGISCQRLVRKLCPDCRQAYQPNTAILKKFNLPADKVKILYRKPDVKYDKHGKPILCKTCQGTGFVGRTGIFETIFMTDELKAAVKTAKSLQEIANHFRRAKMLYLQEQAIRKVADGTTSIDEVIREFSPKKPPVKKRTTDKQ